jgi:sirohydrochlorin cobaltochelatase
LDEAENFRPLPAAPTLRRGWRYRAPNSEALRDALDYLYPAELANAALWQDEKLTATPWHETAERQSGRFRVVRDLDDAEVVELIAQVCEHGCLKRRVWSPAAQTVAPAADDVPLLCPEACNYFVGRVREKLKGADEGKD